MLDTLREGDVVIITELSRLSRSVKDLFEIVEKIHNVGADIKSMKELWIHNYSTGKASLHRICRNKPV